MVESTTHTTTHLPILPVNVTTITTTPVAVRAAVARVAAQVRVTAVADPPATQAMVIATRAAVAIAIQRRKSARVAKVSFILMSNNELMTMLMRGGVL